MDEKLKTLKTKLEASLDGEIDFRSVLGGWMVVHKINRRLVSTSQLTMKDFDKEAATLLDRLKANRKPERKVLDSAQ